MKVKPADFRCPYCRSGNIEVTDNSDVDWGNNDQGTIWETIECLDCGKSFTSNSRVEVVFREVSIMYACPYCGDSNDVVLDSECENGTLLWYRCPDCRKLFAVRSERWYDIENGLTVKE